MTRDPNDHIVNPPLFVSAEQLVEMDHDPAAWNKKVMAEIAAEMEAEQHAFESEMEVRIRELENALKAALDIIGHPDDKTTQALWAVLRNEAAPTPSTLAPPPQQ